MKQYEAILNAETQDILGWISGRLTPPKSVDTPILHRIQEFAKDHPFGKADPKAYEKDKKNIFSN